MAADGVSKRGLYWSQLKAMLVRNVYLKKRDTRKTLAEVLVPLYSLGVLIMIKIWVPNPNFPAIVESRGQTELFRNFPAAVAVVPDTDDTTRFLSALDDQLALLHRTVAWKTFRSQEELLDRYWAQPESVSVAVVFHTDPFHPGKSLNYTIMTNPSFAVTPSTQNLYSSPATCRLMEDRTTHKTTGILPFEDGNACPAHQYISSGFVAVQALIDFTKIKLDSGMGDFSLPEIFLEMFPKPAHTGDSLVAFRIIIPLYMVMTLSQFITYLLILIVGEKEKKIREGMRIMGLIDSVYWASWFILYAIFVLVLSFVSTFLLFALNVFQHSSCVLVFLLISLYGFSIIMFAFLITPFFDRARTAGILGNFAVNILSALYFIQVFVKNADSVAFWFVSLISSSGFALAMDKALLLDMAGVGVTWANLWNGPGIPYGGCLVMMAVDTLLYGLLAYYFDAVIPSEYGIKQRPWFCFLPSFWCGPKHKSRTSSDLNYSNDQASNACPNEDIEPVPREFKEKEAIRIVDLHKSYGSCRKAELKAIDGIDLSIYEGQITAILGHNGAGKSTLFNILTGLTSPTSGTIYIFGLDVRDPQDMNEIRQMTGVCPQHDILFDLLTVEQHLVFFAAVKGLPRWRIEKEVSRTLQEVSLSEVSQKLAKELSGGQKRKLSVGIAIIGDPKIIVLDEPTAGVDPIARRHMWRILQKLRSGRVLLLTTHFMDEADILADRKAVISKGKIRCAGTSLFLKNKFGIGYHLTLVLDGVVRENQIVKLVTSRVPKAEKARRHGRELSFILPYNAVHQFATLFSVIEDEINNKTNRLGICSYGVSMTTLEEVFLHLEGDNEEVDAPVEGLSRKLVKERALSRSLSLQSKTPSYQELHDAELQTTTGIALHATDHGYEHVLTCKKNKGGESSTAANLPMDLSQMEQSIKVRPNTFQIVKTLIWLRIVRMLRDSYEMYMLIILPIVFAAFGLYFESRDVQFLKTHPLALNAHTYPDGTAIALNVEGRESKDIVRVLSSMGAGPISEDYNGSFAELLNLAPNMAALDVKEFKGFDISMVALYNDTFAHSLPIVVNLISNMAFESMIPERWHSIHVTSHPLQQTSHPEGFDYGIIGCSFLIGMIFVLVPVSLAVDMVYDREIKAKNQLRVNGLSLGLYFATYFAVLATIMLMIIAALVVLIMLNDVPSLREPPALVALSVTFAIYCPSSILFSTCLSYIFDRMDSAQSVLPNIATWVGMIPFGLVATLDMLRIGGSTSFYLHIVFSLVNTMYIPYALVYYVDRVHLLCEFSSTCDGVTLAHYATVEMIVLLVGSVVHVPIYCALLRAVDALKAGARIGTFRRPKADEDEDSESRRGFDGPACEREDADVRKERHRVATLLRSPPATPPVLMVHNLRKEYSGARVERGEVRPPPAVCSLSFAVDAGEVFGLLGHNGAGKTTTMKIITAEETPTDGTVALGGREVTVAGRDAFRMLGYCPQHDALWKNIGVREHLECYAAIRGVPERDLSSVVDMYLNGLQLTEHAHKRAEACSGGTRRKLSFAMAMVGAPKLVLLDEPSTGMDPRSKRFLWDTILASFRGRKGAILTTHSMEEADALCSRVGIMVKGGLRCVGSTQHLKNLYGAGYTLEMKLSGAGGEGGSEAADPSEDEGDEGECAIAPLVGSPSASAPSPSTSASPPERVEAATRFVEDLFPEATLEESFADRLVFGVPQRGVASIARCFSRLEAAKESLRIEEYSFGQTTLEQVFLKFAQYDDPEAATQDH